MSKIGRDLRYLHEPGTTNISRALFVAAFMAREHLSLAERDHGIDERICGVAIEQVEKALRNLRAAEGYLDPNGALHSVVKKEDLLRLARQCVHASEAAEAHLKRHNYTSGPADLSRDVQRKQSNICRRSLEAARKDAHKLLAAVMERFPNSYDVEEEEQEEAQEEA